MADRAVLFIDGNNWYHNLKKVGVRYPLGDLDYAKISKKLIGPRDWIETRYYIGRVPQVGDVGLYAEQRKFLSRLEQTDNRITTHLGRLESRPADNRTARELRRYLGNLKTKIDGEVFRELMQIAKNTSVESVLVEKAVDVMLAVDMVVMAERDEFDAAYLLSADGDFTPAISAVRANGRKAYIASTGPGAQLAAVADTFIPLEGPWFDDCV